MTWTGEATLMFYYAVWVLLSLLFNVMKKSIFWVFYQKGLKSRQRPNHHPHCWNSANRRPFCPQAE